VRLYDGDSYVLLDVVDTKDIYGWHTLTYLAFFFIKVLLFIFCCFCCCFVFTFIIDRIETTGH